jgi:hypothetical protein
LKKILVFLLLIVMAVPMVGVSAQVPTADLTTLAEALPANDTLLYAAVRTDDAFIDTLDSALRPFYPLADDLPPNFTLEMGLDFMVQEAGLGTSFNTAVRPWLGDTAAVAAFVPVACAQDPANCNVGSAFDDLGGVMLLSVTNAAAAGDTLTSLATMNNVQISTEQRGAYTVYSAPGVDEVFAISDTRMIVGESSVVDHYNLLSGDFGTLGGNADLNSTIGLLPNGTGYNAVGYLNQPAYAAAYANIAAANDMAQFSEAADTIAFLELSGSLGFGAVIINGDTFTVDVAAAGEISLPNIGAINPAFANNIPSGTPLVVHSTNLAGLYELSLDALERFAEEDPDSNPEDIRTGVAFADNLLRGFVGLGVDDLIGWMTSDYALILNGSEAVLNGTATPQTLEENPVDLAFLADAAGDPAAAVAVVDGIEAFVNGDFVASLTDRDDAEFSVTTTRNGDVLSVVLTDLTASVPFPVELQFGVQNGVFFIATPSMVQAANSGDGGLGGTAAFGTATGVLLPESNAVYYVDFANLMPILRAVQQIDPGDDDLADAIVLFDLLESATFSGAVDGNNVSRARATITLK